jgi:HEAT repeat protein
LPRWSAPQLYAAPLLWSKSSGAPPARWGTSGRLPCRPSPPPSDKDVRRRVADALWKIGPAAVEAVPALAAALNDPDKDVRRRVADALGSIGPPAVEAVPALAAGPQCRDGKNSTATMPAGALR